MGVYVKIFSYLAFAVFILSSGCISCVQHVPLPDQNVGLENPGMARIYVLRPSMTYGKPIEVRDNNMLIGTTVARSYLCWERPAGSMRLTGQAYINLDSRYVNVQRGYVYYYEQVTRGGVFGPAQVVWEMLDGEAGKKALERCMEPKIMIK